MVLRAYPGVVRVMYGDPLRNGAAGNVRLELNVGVRVYRIEKTVEEP